MVTNRPKAYDQRRTASTVPKAIEGKEGEATRTGAPDQSAAARPSIHPHQNWAAVWICRGWTGPLVFTEL
jgi:hypothetical protein